MSSATEQLNIRLAPTDKQTVEASAAAEGKSVSTYARERLLSSDLPKADKTLLQLLGAFRPKALKHLRAIDANLEAVRAMRADRPVAAKRKSRKSCMPWLASVPSQSLQQNCSLQQLLLATWPRRRKSLLEGADRISKLAQDAITH